MLRLRGAPVGALLVFCAAASAGAQDISGKAREAEGFAAQGKFIEAIAALDDASTALWDKAPLTFRKALWVAEAPAGFGAYNPRETNIYASGAEMLAYIEPVGFGWRKSGDVWRTDLAADLVVKAKEEPRVHGALHLHAHRHPRRRVHDRHDPARRGHRQERNGLAADCRPLGGRRRALLGLSGRCGGPMGVFSCTVRAFRRSRASAAARQRSLRDAGRPRSEFLSALCGLPRLLCNRCRPPAIARRRATRCDADHATVTRRTPR